MCGVGPGSGVVGFFFNDTATTEIYALSLHDALPIYTSLRPPAIVNSRVLSPIFIVTTSDRKSTRLNSSHITTSYAVFCLKKKTPPAPPPRPRPTRAPHPRPSAPPPPL